MSTRHLIGRLMVEIGLAGTGQAPARQQEISAWARADDLWRDLSQALDEVVPPGEVLTIPRLELTIEAGSEPVFRAQLRRALTQAVGQWRQGREADPARRSLAHYTEEVAWHFLTTGALPWTAPHSQATAVATFLNHLPDAENEAFGQRLRAESAASPAIWQRLVYAIGIEKAQHLVLRYGQFSPPQAAELLRLAAAVEQQSSLAASWFWHRILLDARLNTREEAAFRQAGQQAAEAAGAQPAAAQPAQLPGPTTPEAQAADRSAAEAYFVQNAGLVLLHQFLPQLFRQANLLADNDFQNEDARFKAIHLLHYLVTGATEAYEYDLILNKLLCNCPLARPVPRWVPLTDDDLTQADALLRAAIQHWSVLRNTSAAGLRETFLQRPGKLSAAPDGGWRLQVERKTVDILLDRLPMGWGYSVVSLPWRPDLLFVEW